MKAWIVTPHAECRLTVEDVALPRPRPQEALVGIVAFGIERDDAHMLLRWDPGGCPGREFAGIVLEAAADGSGPPRGTRVVGLVDGGAWAERVAAPTSTLVPVPETMSTLLAATLPIAGICARRTVELASCHETSRVLVAEAAEPMGSLQVQMAARRGAHVTAVAETPDATEWLQRSGATEIVPSLADAKGSFDVLFQPFARARLTESISKTVPNGTVVVSGYGSVAPTSEERLDLMGQHPARVLTFMNDTPDEHTGQHLQRVVNDVAQGHVVPWIGRVDTWENLRDAVHALRHDSLLGKAVLCIPSGGSLD